MYFMCSISRLRTLSQERLDKAVFCSIISLLPFIDVEAWLSLVERCVRDAEAVGSNPVASTMSEQAWYRLLRFFIKVKVRPCRGLLSPLTLCGQERPSH